MNKENKIGLSNPFNYTGSKHRYLRDLFEVLPKEDNLTVCDPFCGGGDLSMHLPASWAVDASDMCKQLIEMHDSIKSGAINVDCASAEYARRALSKTNEPEFLSLRSEYNETKDPSLLYLLLTSSFNNQMRFNKSDCFNMPFGKNRSSFNPAMKNKLIDYSSRLNDRDVEFYCKSAFDVDFKIYDITLIDPPYLNTVATYNENGGWSDALEIKLHDKVKSECNKFVYFGQTVSNGIENKLLIDFAKNYNVKILKTTTDSCSSTKKKKGETVEVMIWNF